MIELIYLAAFVLAAYGTGSFFLNLVKIKFRSFGEEAVFAQAVGLVIFSYATFVIGLSGLLHSIYFRILLVLLLLVFFRRVKRLGQYLWHNVRHQNYGLKLDTALVLLIIVFALLNLAAALAPVHSSDAIAHHIAVPKIYAEQHRITNIPDIIPSNYPLAANMLFLDGYLLQSGELSELIAVYIGLLLALALYFFCARYFTKRTGLIAAAVFYTLPIFSLYNVRGFVDISTGLFAFLALYAFFIWHSTGKKSMIVVSAVMAGVAASTKTSAVLTPVIIGLFFAYDYWIIKRKRGFNGLALFVVVAVATMLPWIVRAWLNTGNPFYPVFYNVFGGEYMNALLAQYWTETLARVGLGTNIIDLVLLPWNATMHSTAFRELLGIGPVFLAFVPILILMRNVDKKIKVLLVMALAFILPWFFTAQILRYIFVVFAVLSVVSAYVINRMLNKNLAIIAATSFVVVLGINTALWAGANGDEVAVVAGLQPREEFLSQKVANYNLLQHANENLEDAKICLYGDIRGYYSQHPYVGCHPAWQGYIDYAGIDSSTLLERYEEIGITHLLVENSMFTDVKGISSRDDLVEQGNKAVQELVEGNAKLIYENAQGKLYEIIY